MRWRIVLVVKVSRHNLFLVMGFEPCPWIEPDLLKARFREVAARMHPDSQGGSMDEFTVLNEAFTVLRDPGKRLRHLVELEFPNETDGSTDKPDKELFSKTATALESGRKALAAGKTIRTALGKAALRSELFEARKLVSQALKQADQELAVLENRLKRSGENWRSNGAAFFLNVSAQFIYLERWHRELSEMRFLLEN